VSPREAIATAMRARATVAQGLRVLERLGVLSRIRRRVRVGWRSFQATNRYVLHSRTEFTQRPAFKSKELK